MIGVVLSKRQLATVLSCMVGKTIPCACIWVTFRVNQFSKQIIFGATGGLEFLVYFFLYVFIL